MRMPPTRHPTTTTTVTISQVVLPLINVVATLGRDLVDEERESRVDDPV